MFACSTMAHEQALTNREMYDLFHIYFSCNENETETVIRWREQFPNRSEITRYTIRTIVYNLREWGTFETPAHAQGRGQSGLPVDVQEAILDYFSRQPRASTRDAKRHFHIAHTTVWRLLRDERMHPFHYQRVQDIALTDYHGRVTFCEWMQANLHQNILWTDEALFTRVGLFNVHNEHWWDIRSESAAENPHKTKKDSFQIRFSLNVWAGILGNTVLGPYFIEGRLTGESYLEILQEQVMNQMMEDVPLALLSGLYFQHDGAPPHYSRVVREYLNDVFGERWIGRGGPIPWPPRSPDLTPLDFYLWGDVKRLVYEREDEYENVDLLRAAIEDAFDHIKNNQTVLTRLQNNLQRRVALCMVQGGGYFEHLLKVT